MEKDLWQECLHCKNVCCCKEEIAYPLFLTSEERERVEKILPNGKDFNKKFPCPFLNNQNLCDVHEIRPVDCRLFPFDMIKIGGDFFWIIWNVRCPITNYKEKEFEPCLLEFEEKIIPLFKNYLIEYSALKPNGLHGNYSYKILRKINLLKNYI